jgi:hypothetical protein
MNEINDMRDRKMFSKFTFSNYKKCDVVKALLKAYRDSNYEASCYWSAELVCGGHFVDLWDIIFLYMSKYIHIGNPKLPIYIDTCINTFRDVMNNEYISDELSMRNHNKIRNLFAEISIILVDSNRKHCFAENKVSTTDFDVSNIGNKLRAPHVHYIKNVFKEGDTKEIYIALNELYYNIEMTKDSVMSCYWIEWMLEFDALMRKNKKKNLCERRSYIPVSNEDQANLIWIVWDVLLELAKSEINKKTINALLNIFCLRFTKGIPKKRKYIMYFAVSLLTENINYQIPLIKSSDNIKRIKDGINIIYKEIKKNEITPKTDYLFANLKSSKEKSIEKMKILDSIKF